jgi:hypothetical protein
MEHDLEKHQGVANHYEDPTGAVPDESFEYGDSLYAKLQRFAGRFNIEQRGIERVPENERTDTSYVNIGSMVSSELCIPSFVHSSIRLLEAVLCTDIWIVVGRKHGSALLHYRSAGESNILLGIRGCGSGDPLF